MEKKSVNPKIVEVFVAGSITLKKEREAIRDLFMSINNAVNGLMFFYVKAFDDFGVSSQQKNYDEYIRRADYVIFLIDQEIGTGEHTLKEFKLAREIHDLNEEGRPKILVFYRQIHEMIPHPELILECNKHCHYYTLYSDVADLRSQLLYQMFIDVVNAQNEIIKHLKFNQVDMRDHSEFVAEDDKVVPLPLEEEFIAHSYVKDLRPSNVGDPASDCPGVSRNVVIDVVKKLHASLINATKSILTMVHDLADNGDLSFPKQVVSVSELKECMQASTSVLPDYVYAEVETYAINYPQKGYNTVLNVLRETLGKGVTSLDVAGLEALHDELLKAMPVDETQDQLNALIRTLQDYCNSL